MRSPLHRARERAGEDPALGDDVDENDGQDREYDISGDERPVRFVLAEEVVDRKRHRPVVTIAQEVQRRQEVVPDVEDVENPAGHHHRRQHRKDDRDEGSDRRAAVDEGRFIKVPGHRVDERVDQEDVERDLRRRVDQDDSDLGVDQIRQLHHLGEHDVVRRNGDAHDEKQVDDLVAATPVASQHVGGKSGQENGHDRRSEGIQDTVEESRHQVALVNDGAEVAPLWVRAEVRRS